MKYYILLSALLFGSLSKAGNDWFETGNGGFVLQCENKQTEVLDLYEAVSSHKWSLDVPEKSTTSLDARIDYLLSKLAKQDRYRADLFKEWYKEFFENANFLTGYTIHPLPDVGFTFIPTNCKLELAVYQREPGKFAQYRYTINKDLWSQLDITNQAALIMHELIYREARSFEGVHKTSQSTRMLNAWLNSTDFALTTTKEYLESLQELRFQRASYNGYTLILGRFDRPTGSWQNSPLHFHNAHSVKDAVVATLNEEASAWRLRANHCLFSHVIGKLVSQRVILNPDGGLLRLSVTMPKDLWCEVLLPSENLYINASRFNFESRDLLRITGVAQFGNVITVQGYRIYFGSIPPEISYVTNAQNQLTEITFPHELCWSETHNEMKIVPGSFEATYVPKAINKTIVSPCK